MARDPLPTLLRLHRLTMDDALRRLSLCKAAEVSAAEGRKGADAAIAREAALTSSENEMARRAFARWVPQALAKRDTTNAELQRAVAATQVAGAALASARSRLRALQDRLALRVAEQRAADTRDEQRQLDEIAAPRRQTTVP